MKIQVRIDEGYKSNAQVAQRELTYQAARILRENGIACEVREFFTGTSVGADAAGIFLELPK